MQQIPAHWLSELDEILALLERNPDDGVSPAFVSRMLSLDPDLLTFLIGQFTDQDSPQAAAVLEALATQPDAPAEIRERAAAGLQALAERGVAPADDGAERFVAGWAQECRERGEQIVMLCWRVAPGSFEALVFLLDWRGDGLKDFYRTRRMKEDEWLQLVEHNREKGAPLAPINLAQARALLEASLAESRRFSRSLPRDYKLESALIDRRITDGFDESAPLPGFVSPSLSPEEVVSAFVGGLHYRDYLLVAMLLDNTHALRDGQSVAETAEALRLRYKRTPRRERDVKTVTVSGGDEGSVEAVVEAVGAQIVIEPTGRRVRQQVSERYTLRRDHSWRIVNIGS